MEKKNYLTANTKNKIQRWLRRLAPYQKLYRQLDFTANNSALLVIDMQGFFLDNTSHAFVPAAATIIPNVRKLVDTFREKRGMVVFTKYVGTRKNSNMMTRWWKHCVLKTEDVEIADELKPRPQDVVIEKDSYSAFHNTDLEAILLKHNIRNVIIAGVVTNLCCETAAREAFTHGFSVVFSMDATASYNEELHFSSLITLAHGFSLMRTTEQIIGRLNK
jgi:nicotinamidase-related amidase